MTFHTVDRPDLKLSVGVTSQTLNCLKNEGLLTHEALPGQISVSVWDKRLGPGNGE